MIKMNSEEKAFWKKLGIKTFVMFGFTLFSTLTALQLSGIQNFIAVISASGIAGGLYFFSELMKYYKLEPDKKVLSKSQTKLYSFIF